MAKVPVGNAARATRRVASGIGCSSFARNDIRLLPALLGARKRPTHPTDQGPVEFATSVNTSVTRGHFGLGDGGALRRPPNSTPGSLGAGTRGLSHPRRRWSESVPRPLGHCWRTVHAARAARRETRVGARVAGLVATRRDGRG